MLVRMCIRRVVRLNRAHLVPLTMQINKDAQVLLLRRLFLVRMFVFLAEVDSGKWMCHF